MAHTKSGGKTRQHSQRAGKRLGLKIFGGEKVKIGQIIIRQRGTKFHAGQGVEMGRDHTLFAVKEGIVQYKKRQGDNLVVVA
jgi:large subunit ribosomal protein L27